MKETIKRTEMDIGDYFAIIKRHGTKLLTTIMVVTLTAIVLALKLPPTYQSTATFLVERQEIPKNLVQTTWAGYVTERIEAIAQRVMTDKNLLEIADKYSLFTQENNNALDEERVAKMRGNISREVITSTVVNPNNGREIAVVDSFTVSFEAKTPELAQAVTADLAERYRVESTKASSEIAESVSSFIETEANRLGKLVSEYEDKLAEFKQKYALVLPEMAAINRSLLADAQNSLDRTEQRIQSLSSQRAELLERQQDAVENSVLDQIRKLQEEIQVASAKYSPDHPDLQRMRRELNALVAHSDASTKNADVGKEASLANSQNSLRLAQRIKLIEEELETENNMRSQWQRRITEYEQRIRQAPVVERDYLAISRGYENTLKSYHEIKEKEMGAKLAEQLEVKQKGDRFTLAGPPTLPQWPIKPNRLGIVLLGLMFAFSAGIGVVTVAEYRDHSIRGGSDVVTIFGAPPLVLIPYIQNTEDDLRRRKGNLVKISMIVFISLFVAMGVYSFYSNQSSGWSKDWQSKLNNIHITQN